MKDKVKINEIISQIKQIIISNKGIISQNEAITKTGYSKDEVVTAFNRMLELFESKVLLNQETGGLQFIFKYPLWMRGKKTMLEKFASVWKIWIKILKQIYKISIGIVLIGYTILFAILLIGISFMSRGNNNNDRGNNFGIDIIGLLFRAIIQGLFWHNVTRPYYYQNDSYGNKYKVFHQEKEKKGAGFIKSVFSFVFGPEMLKYDHLNDVKEVAAFIRTKSKGKLTCANIIELSGVDFDIAESKLAEYCGKFNGELIITNDGLLYGDFQNLVENSSFDEEKYIQYYKDEIEPPVEFTGNKFSRNVTIFVMNGFNLIMSMLLVFSNFDNVAAGSIPTDGRINLMTFAQYFFLAYFPFAVSVMYYLIPILRIPSYLSNKEKRKKNVIRKFLIGYICSSRKKSFYFSELLMLLKNKMEIDDKMIHKILNEIVIELKGTIDISESGQECYVFERLYLELIFK